MRRLSTSYILLLVVLLFTCTMNAAPIQMQQARQYAESFLSNKGMAVAKRTPVRVQAKQATTTDETAYYVFHAEGGGFVVISGEDQTAPVLGFCDKGLYDADNLPEGLQWLLQMYEEQIQSLRSSADNVNRVAPKKVASRASSVYHHIEPLLSTLWNQGRPYNLLCPRYYNQDGSLGDLSATGCVATAIAQVMAYYRYPNATLRTIPGYVQRYQTAQGDKSVQLRNVPANSVIDWENMLDAYYGNESEAQQQAVAQLMYWIGLGCKMGCGASSAAGFPEGIKALKTYFGYDDGTHIESRGQHTLQGWIDLLYDELANGHPIAFAGTNSGGAHAFVLDGYDVDGLFHVNWGWGGLDNGYFRIDVLDPDDNSGIGASPAPGGYNMGQDAIIGMRLPDGVLSTTNDYRLSVNDWEIRNGNTFFANYVNWSGVDADWNFGIGRVNDDGSITLIGNSQTVRLNQNYYTSWEFPVRGLTEGTYRIVPVSKRTVDKQWQTHLNPFIYYVQADVNGNGQVSLEIHPLEYVEVTGITFPGNHKRGDTQPVCATFRNHGEEYYHEVFLFAARNNEMAQSVCRTAVSIGVGGESTAMFNFVPQQSGTWTIWLATDSEGKNCVGQATVEITDNGLPNTDNLRFVSLTVTNRSNGAVYGNCIQGKVSILNQGNEDFNGKVRLWLFKLADDGYYYGQSSMFVPISAAPRKTAQASYFFDHLQMNAVYAMSILYEKGGDIYDGGLKQIGRTQTGIVCWLSDNSLKGMAPASLVNIPSNALAVDMSSLDSFSGTIHTNSNPNTLYFFRENAKVPEGLEEANVVLGNHAQEIRLSEGWGFLSPLSFEADAVSYQCEPVKGKWKTLALPFAIDALPEGVSVLEFSALDDENKPVFTPTTTIQRNIPYLLRDDEHTLLTLSASHAKISATQNAPMIVGAGDYRFMGTTISKSVDDVMVLNEEGNTFVRSSGQLRVSPFSAYFVAPMNMDIIPIPEMIDNGIAQRETDSEETSSAYYNLSGQRVEQPRKGIYIRNHKKVIVR